MSRHFNTAGPCNPEDHYIVPPVPRLPDARELIDQKGYFVVHAPRQTGKTTTLRALAQALTAEGRYAALHVTCEEASIAGENYGAALRALLGAMRTAAEIDLPREHDRIVHAGDRLVQKGVKQGLEQGLQSQREMLLRQLRVRFGELPEWAVLQVNAAGSAELTALAERIITAPDLSQANGSKWSAGPAG